MLQNAVHQRRIGCIIKKLKISTELSVKNSNMSKITKKKQPEFLLELLPFRDSFIIIFVVLSIDWYNCGAFCQVLSSSSTFRLPSDQCNGMITIDCSTKDVHHTAHQIPVFVYNYYFNAIIFYCRYVFGGCIMVMKYFNASGGKCLQIFATIG